VKHAEANLQIDVVFCAIDFSDTAALALTYATRLARRHDAAMVLGHIVESLPIVPYPTLELPPDGGLELRRWATERLEKEAATIRETGLDINVVFDDGRPGPKLIEMAESAGASLFVIGTHGLSGIEHLILGSTAEYILRRSSCPVLIIHPDDGPPRSEIDTVVIPTDLSPDAGEAAMDFAKLADRDPRSRAILAFVDATPPYLQPFRHEILAKWNQPDRERDEIESKMEPMCEKLRAAGFEVETAVLDGDPARAIARLASKENADMILMSTHGRSALTNLLSGRTAQRIVQHAPCPVLTLHSALHSAPDEE
jgi:nucleotide-binding universal stress UspA family protein